MAPMSGQTRPFLLAFTLLSLAAFGAGCPKWYKVTKPLPLPPADLPTEGPSGFRYTHALHWAGSDAALLRSLELHHTQVRVLGLPPTAAGPEVWARLESDIIKQDHATLAATFEKAIHSASQLVGTRARINIPQAPEGIRPGTLTLYVFGREDLELQASGHTLLDVSQLKARRLAIELAGPSVTRLVDVGGITELLGGDPGAQVLVTDVTSLHVQLTRVRTLEVRHVTTRLRIDRLEAWEEGTRITVDGQPIRELPHEFVP